MMAARTQQQHVRDERLQNVLDYGWRPHSGWERPAVNDIKRWLCVEEDERGHYWLADFDRHNDALGYFHSTEGNWQPVCLIDLDFGNVYNLVSSVRIDGYRDRRNAPDLSISKEES